jgi:hypothetical protein
MIVYVHFCFSRSVNICISPSEGNTPELSILNETVTGLFGFKDPEGSIDTEVTEIADTV